MCSPILKGKAGKGLFVCDTLPQFPVGGLALRVAEHVSSQGDIFHSGRCVLGGMCSQPQRKPSGSKQALVLMALVSLEEGDIPSLLSVDLVEDTHTCV